MPASREQFERFYQERKVRPQRLSQHTPAFTSWLGRSARSTVLTQSGLTVFLGAFWDNRGSARASIVGQVAAT